MRDQLSEILQVSPKNFIQYFQYILVIVEIY
jgi:hypothetical protein